MTASFLPLALLLVSPVPAHHADPGDGPGWPQWRGPNRDATSPEVGLLERWPAEGPQVLWRVEVGAGFSGVAVAGGELYTMWDEDGVQLLSCLSASDGKRRWTAIVGPGFQHPYGSGPRSTPTLDGDRVFAIGTSGKLLALERHGGEVLWEHDLIDELGARLPSYGYASSPLVVGERLIVETAGKSAAYSALDRRTGKILWSAQDDAPAYSSPMLASLGGSEQVLFWSASAVHSIAPDTGQELWSHPWSTDCPVSGDPLGTGSPIFVAPDGLLLSSGSGTALLRISSSDEGLRAREAWHSRVLRNDVNSSVLVGDHVYGFDGGTLKCVDVRTGEATWEHRGYRKGSLIAADGRLIVLSEAGELALVEQDPEKFVERCRAPVLHGGRNWTSPALADGRLFLRNHEELVCVSLRP